MCEQIFKSKYFFELGNITAIYNFFPGSTEPTGPCSPGYYCTDSANNSMPVDGMTGNICPEGRYCPEGSALGLSCPVKTFSKRLGLQNSSECELCTPGHYCSTTGLTAPSAMCWAGKSDII